METFSFSPTLLFVPSFPTLPYPSSLWDLPSFHNFFFFFRAHRRSVLFSSVRFGEYLIHLHLHLSLPCLLALLVLFVCFNSTAQLYSTQTNTIFTHTAINQSIRLGACLPACRPAGFLARAAFPVPGLVISTSPPPSLRSLTLLLCTIRLAIAGGVFFEWGGGGWFAWADECVLHFVYTLYASFFLYICIYLSHLRSLIYTYTLPPS